MADQPIVGAYVRDAGVWKRANAGTPEGFSGPQVYKSAAWENSLVVYGNASAAWQTCWVPIPGELNFQNFTSSDFDLSPYTLDTLGRIRGDGGLDRLVGGSLLSNFAHWRLRDCGREYECYIEHNGGSTSDTTPTLSTWLALTDPDTDHVISDTETGTGVFFKNGSYLVKLREKISAPAGGNTSAVYSFEMSAEP